MRFVQASPLATGVTLYRADVAQPDATNTTYGFASDYFDIDTGVADWSAKTATSTLGSVSIDPERGTKYTIVSLAASATDNTVALIVDPYNKTLTSDSTRLRLMNASYNAASLAESPEIAGIWIRATTRSCVSCRRRRSRPA